MISSGTRQKRLFMPFMSYWTAKMLSNSSKDREQTENQIRVSGPNLIQWNADTIWNWQNILNVVRMNKKMTHLKDKQSTLCKDEQELHFGIPIHSKQHVKRTYSQARASLPLISRCIKQRQLFHSFVSASTPMKGKHDYNIELPMFGWKG